MKAQTPTSVMAVANWFIQKGIEDDHKTDQMKLNKLVYYAYAWYAGNTKSVLFDEDIEAWPHGPVVRELYVRFKGFEDLGISKTGNELTGEPTEEIEDEYILDLFEKVWACFREWSGMQMSVSSHKDNEPWDLVLQRHGGKLIQAADDRYPVIPKEDIKEVFKKLVDELKSEI